MVVFLKSTKNGCFSEINQKWLFFRFFSVSLPQNCLRMKSEVKGIITGDIVNSSAIKGEEKIALIAEIERIGLKLSELVPLKIELFRGDSFQIQTDDPTEAIRLAILFRTALKSASPSEHEWDARVSVGIGSVDFVSEQIVVSDGEAFQLSGRGLDSIGKRRLAVATPWADVNGELSLTTAFADDIITGWSVNQARISYLKLSTGDTQKEIAREENITAQNVSKILVASRVSLITDYISRSEFIIKQKLNEL